MGLEVERVHRQLVDASRQAGQAEVASSVLHNVGNVLNSVNVSTCLIADRLRKLRLANVSKVAALLQQHSGDLSRFLTEDEKGRQLPNYLENLGHHLVAAQTDLLTETKDLAQNIEHIKEIVAMQQTYAQVSGVTETIAPAELVESAFKMHSDAFVRHGVRIVREFDEVPPVTVDKHRVLQILVNLLHNAKQACAEGDRLEKRVQVRINRAGNQGVKIEVADNGVGIPRENLTRIFGHGFTTRKNGHGFGLHSSALAAKELGGTLTVQSEGSGQGAIFTLEIPVTDHAPAEEILAVN
jgi:signal transduction histidine kinase